MEFLKCSVLENTFWPKVIENGENICKQCRSNILVKIENSNSGNEAQIYYINYDRFAQVVGPFDWRCDR